MSETYELLGREDLHPSREGAPDPQPIPSGLERRRVAVDSPSPWSSVPSVDPTPVRSCAIVVERDQYHILDDNIFIQAPNTLADAIRTAGVRYPRGCVIGVRGIVKGIDLGGPYGAQNKSQTAYWSNGRPIRGLRIIGLDDDAGIEGVTVWDGLGGVDDVRFERLTFWNPRYSKTPLLTAMNQVHGTIAVYWCQFKASYLDQYMGKGMMWGWRGHGPARWDVRDCHVEPCQEHSGYGDNYQGTSYFLGITGGGNGRTFLQHTNRTTSGPSQFGDIFVQDCSATNVDDFGGGGSDYTFVGCAGTVYVKDCQTIGGRQSNGALVFWTDTSNGNYLIDGYTTTRAVVENFTAKHAGARRSLMMVSGVKDFELHQPFTLEGPTVSLDLDTTYGGPIKNGSVEIFGRARPSTYLGFAAPVKVRRSNRVLSAREIDQMWATPTRRSWF